MHVKPANSAEVYGLANRESSSYSKTYLTAVDAASQLNVGVVVLTVPLAGRLRTGAAGGVRSIVNERYALHGPAPKPFMDRTCQ